MNDTDGIRIKLSLGLVAIALIHAAACAVLCLGMRPAKKPEPAPWNVPQYCEPNCYPPVSASPQKLEQPQSVNLAAQGELKQQSGCIDCPPIVVRPGERVVRVGPARPVVPSSSPTLAPPDPLLTPNSYPPSVLVNDAVSSRPPAKQYQLLLFLDRSSQSQQIHEWFSNNRELFTLRSKSEFQIYTQDNALYRQRYARLVPPEQFPAIVLQDASGGHIHACGKSMIPSTPEQLVSDMRTGFTLYKQAKQGSMQATGAMKATGYSWDDQINPQMRLQSGDDCGPDGCPPDRWRPFDRDGGGLFDGVGPSGAEALLWANAGDMVIMGLVLVGLVAVVIILSKATRR